MNDIKITKSNALVSSSYRLSLNELRIVLFGLSHIDPTAKEFPLFHTVKIKELAEFFNIGEKDRGSFYDNVRHALIQKFWEREYSYFDEQLKKTIKNRWLIQVQYGNNDGSLAYYYNPMIKDQLQQLASKFTSYFLKNIAEMKSVYAVRLYEISIMYLKASQKDSMSFTKEIEALKTHLDLNGKYLRFSNFKLRVIDPAKKEINRYSDIKFSYTIIKQGRVPKEIKFTVSYREKQKEEQLLLLETQTINLSPTIIEKAKDILLKRNCRFDIYDVVEQFKAYAKKMGTPKNVNGAFIGFVKKKIDKTI